LTYNKNNNKNKTIHKSVFVKKNTSSPPSLFIKNDIIIDKNILKSIVVETEENLETTIPVTFIDWVYYFNSFHNPLRRAYVEGWLEKYQLPYQQIKALAGVNTTGQCNNKVEESDCLLGLRVSNTYRYLLSNAPSYYNTSGTVLILEHDDIEISTFTPWKNPLKGFQRIGMSLGWIARIMRYRPTP
jgi:hypothetical protein